MKAVAICPRGVLERLRCNEDLIQETFENRAPLPNANETQSCYPQNCSLGDMAQRYDREECSAWEDWVGTG